MRFRHIKFLKRDWLLVGQDDGAITTAEDYSHGIASFAHLYEDGIISRYGSVIGTRDDIEFGDEAPEPKIDASAYDNIGTIRVGWRAG